MHIKCPNCGGVASLDILLAAEDGASEVVKISGEMQPSLFKLAVQYLGLFRPLKTGKLSWSRMAKILGELHEMVKAAEFEHGKQRYIAPLAYWQTAIEQVLAQRDKLTLPLNGHGYLLKIMIGIDAKAAKTPEPAPKTEEEKTEKQTPPEPPKAAQPTVNAKAILDTLYKTVGAKTIVKEIPKPASTVSQQQREAAEADLQRLLNQEKHNRTTQPKE